MAKVMETIIRIGGNLDDSLQKAIKFATDNLDELQRVQENASKSIEDLSATLDDQEEALKAAKKAYASYVLAGEDGSKEAAETAYQIRSLSKEIRANKARMAEAEKAADSLAEEYDDVADSVDNASDNFTLADGVLSNVIGNGITNLAGSAMDAVSNVYGLADSTRELRQDLTSLTTAYDSAGFSSEQATNTWRTMYGILGEEDRAVEASNNISRLAESEQDLNNWTRILTGVLGTYQDALPVESLAEAAAETVRTGTVTGTLADALNWSSEAAELFSDYMSEDVTTAEDAFNEALKDCTSEQERNTLITNTMLALYGEAADTYRETAASSIEAQEAQADYTLSLADLGEKIEPVTTAVSEGMTEMLGAALEWTEGVDWEGVADTVSGAMDNASDAINFLTDNFEYVAVVAAGVIALIVALKWDSIVGSVNRVKGAVSGLWKMISTNPMSGTIAIITAVVAALVWLYQNWDLAKEKMQQFGSAAWNVWQSVDSVVSNAIASIGEKFPMLAGFLSGLWSSVQAVANNLKNIFNSLIDFIGNVFAGNWSAAWQNITDIFGNIFGALGNLAKAPINAVIGTINGAINGINSISIDIPDWVPVFGGQTFGFSIPTIPMLAKGGFTDGVSIAGEAGQEAVISFDKSVHNENVQYWQEAGQILGVTAEDAYGALTGSYILVSNYSNGGNTSNRSTSRSSTDARSSYSTVSNYDSAVVYSIIPSASVSAGGIASINLGGVTFAPEIILNGKGDGNDVIEQIRAEYPDFLDILEDWLAERGEGVYAK